MASSNVLSSEDAPRPGPAAHCGTAGYPARLIDRLAAIDFRYRLTQIKSLADPRHALHPGVLGLGTD